MSASSFDFAMYDLTNGTKVESDTETLEIGSIISLVTDAGKELAPTGPHTLADGRTIVLDDSSKVTEIKEADAPTVEEAAKEEDMKKHIEKMALEMDPELVSAVSEIIKKKATGMSDEDLSSLSNELIMAIVAYDELSENEAEAEDSTTTVEDMNSKFSELSAIVLEMAKEQKKFSAELSKVPSAKAISELEFSSEPETTDLVALRIQAIKNLNK